MSSLTDTTEIPVVIDLRTESLAPASPEEAPASPGTGVAQRRRPVSPWRIAVGTGALALAGMLVLFVVYLFVVSTLPQQRTQRSLQQQLAAELQAGVAPVGGRIERGRPIALVEIPALGVRQAVVSGTDGERTAMGPGHLPDSSFPGARGTSVIVGRRSTHGAPFAGIDRLDAGDAIAVTTAFGTASYEVRLVSAGTLVGTLPVTGDRLVLVTSDPWLAPRGQVVVEAVLTTPPSPAPAATAALSIDLGADGDTVLPLLLWLEALLAAAVVTVVLRARWPRPTVWLLTTPVLLALGVLVCEHAALLLPATF
jgi:sortase A